MGVDVDDFAKRAWMLEQAAEHRDWQAIEACGLCDARGFVVVETGLIPTVAFCRHRTTIAAPPPLRLLRPDDETF
jgi:hypothetical protein